MQYQIQGQPYPVVVLTVEPEETVLCQKGAMAWMTPNMEMQTKGGGLGKMFSRAFTGESMFQNHYTAKGGQGMIAFASAVPGEIMPVQISPERSIVAQKSAFLASEAGVNFELFFQKKLAGGFFGGEGFIMQKFSGNGMLFLEALRSGARIDMLYVGQESGGLQEIISLAKEQGIPVKVVTESKLTQLTGGAVHQGVAAEGACGTYVSLEELLERAAEKGEPPLLVLCDGIQDPHNLGAIIRTAEAAGAHGVIIPKRRSASLTLTVGKTSAGAASWLPVARVPNLASAMEILKKNNVWIYGTDAAGTSYTDADFTGGTAFVIGSEGFGMSRLVGEKCDAMLSLPMRGKVNSLNASVAAGIFLYEAVRQRLAK